MAGNHKSRQSQVALRERRWPGFWGEDIHGFFDRAFRDPLFGRGLLLPTMRREAGWMPDMDVFERAGKTVIRADLPGIKREDVEVTVDKDMLLIRGHREEGKEVEEENYYHCERASGKFSRGISLPESAKAEDIEATYQDGVLEVILPKPAATPEPSVKVPVK